MDARRVGMRTLFLAHRLELTDQALARFAEGLQEDLAAITAGLTLPWSNGPVEGQVNRLKLLKREGYGRASVRLLRQRLMTRR